MRSLNETKVQISAGWSKGASTALHRIKSMRLWMPCPLPNITLATRFVNYINPEEGRDRSLAVCWTPGLARILSVCSAHPPSSLEPAKKLYKICPKHHRHKNYRGIGSYKSDCFLGQSQLSKHDSQQKKSPVLVCGTKPHVRVSRGHFRGTDVLTPAVGSSMHSESNWTKDVQTHGGKLSQQPALLNMDVEHLFSKNGIPVESNSLFEFLPSRWRATPTES